jgi:cell division protein FtsB
MSDSEFKANKKLRKRIKDKGAENKSLRLTNQGLRQKIKKLKEKIKELEEK